MTQPCCPDFQNDTALLLSPPEQRPCCFPLPSLAACCSKAEGSTQHTSNSKLSKPLPFGNLPQEQLGTYLARLDRLLAKAQARHDEERSSHGSKRQGHQKTPSLILTLAEQASLLRCAVLRCAVLCHAELC